MTRQQPTTIAIFDGATVLANGLALLLKGEGYDIEIIQESPTAFADGVLVGVDLLLLSPALSSRARDGVLNNVVVRGNPKTAAMPVLTLSTAPTREPRETLSDQTGMVPWPSRLEDLRRVIEAALTPTTSSEG